MKAVGEAQRPNAQYAVCCMMLQRRVLPTQLDLLRVGIGVPLPNPTLTATQAAAGLHGVCIIMNRIVVNVKVCICAYHQHKTH